MIQVNRKRLLVMALYAGEIMLKNGAETYRVEDTITRLCKSRNFSYVEAYVTPTGIIISIDNEGEDHNEMVSYVKRITSRSIDLNKVAEVNDFSRKFVESAMSVDEALAQLKTIENSSSYSLKTQAVFGGIASAFLALLFDANLFEFFAALITSIIVTFALLKFSKAGLNLFVTNIIGGFLAAFFAILFSLIHPQINIDMVIIGALMTMVPGVAITNALRDTIAGDLVSGLARGTEALLVAISIAFGVGFTLQGWIYLTGGTLL